jgi:hypothetical protein
LFSIADSIRFLANPSRNMSRGSAARAGAAWRVKSSRDATTAERVAVHRIFDSPDPSMYAV